MFRLHLWAFVLVNLGLTVANWFTGGDWWAFWPLVFWGAVLVAHYLIYKSKRVDARWVEGKGSGARKRGAQAGARSDRRGCRSRP